eukprot:14620796-Alexandrium_andersonii.AAC.1
MEPARAGAREVAGRLRVAMRVEGGGDAADSCILQRRRGSSAATTAPGGARALPPDLGALGPG